MNSNEIRTLFLRFFEEKEHLVLPSSSLIPVGDPTLLLTTAGMVQIKPYFLGLEPPPRPRLASCQKCFRTTDIDRVGDAGHLTFFEMLGNFSVGDYFKKEAIAWAWELITQRFKLPLERLWITIFLDDDDAFKFWRQVGVPADRIVRLGEKDNFWGPAGDSGPCGPCSEIHFDLLERPCDKPDCLPGCDCGRYLEIWNLVFTQYNQDKQGKRTLLPKPNIDTGMGLERMAVVMQGKRSAYETDFFSPLINLVAGIVSKEYGRDQETDRVIRVIAEHSRGITFLIADGVVPGNEGRGYVLRRVLRRTVLFGRKLGLNRPFLRPIAEKVVELMGDTYPELKTGRSFLLKVIELEEARFAATLDSGLGQLEKIMAEATASGKDVIGGPQTFMLYDTCGFPTELTAEVAGERGFSVDLEGFKLEMERQRERARASQKFGTGAATDYAQETLPPTEFTGYEEHRAEARIVALRIDGKAAEQARAGQEAEVILDRTPFYAEMGGQITDTGSLSGKQGKMAVQEAFWATPVLVAHKGKVIEGTLSLGETVVAEIDRERRAGIANHHTATHLLQAALRQVLGAHVQQRGSLVAPDRLRFDFSHLEPVTKEQLLEIQRLVNAWIRDDFPLRTTNTTYKEALKEGATALFGEKYGETVRLVQIGEPPISAELCGGTHVRATGEIGFFQIASEGGVGAGLRRIEAVAGKEAETLVEKRFLALDKIAEQLQSPPEETPSKLAALAEELAAERRCTQTLEKELSARLAKTLLEKVESVDGVNVLTARVEGLGLPALRELGDRLKAGVQSGIIVLGAIIKDKPQFLALVTADLTARGYHAGEIVKQVAHIAGGGGGGRADMAQAGGKDKEKLDEALQQTKKLAKRAAGEPGVAQRRGAQNAKPRA